ncbi:MAG: RagB/SusD family nutrient uptake outer membrane protein [Reichenbachiella sp.]
MKKIIYTICLAVCFLPSCMDTLEVDQLTSKTSANYFTTVEEANDALVGCYDGLQRVWANGVALPVAASVMADMAFGGTGAGDSEGYPMMDEHDYSVSPGDNPFRLTWADYYAGIYRCNSLLVNLDNVDFKGDESTRNNIEAQAKFLRAFMYFDLVRMFERVPLLEVPSKENIPQADPDDTYILITNDLLFAIEHTNNTPFAGIGDTDHGRAHKWAAEALMARVYLYYTGYYGQNNLVGLVNQSQALGYVEDVISAGGFSLVSEFSDLFPAAATYAAAVRGDSISNATYAGETNSEVVFAIKYTYTSDWSGNADGNHWMVMNGLRNQSYGEYGYGSGWGACTVMSEAYASWDDADTRKAASIMAIEEEGIAYDQADDVKEYTGYFTKKYTPTANVAGESIAQDVYPGVSFMISQFQDYFSIRYSDVLLMAAELGSPSALTYLQEVQSRSGATLATAVTKDVIFEERKLEFAFEGLRYWDLLRYDNTLQYAADQISYTGTVKTGGNDVTKVIDGANIKTTRGLCKIPDDQISLSDGVLKQNPGWE